MEFGESVRSRRELLGWTRDELAARSGYSTSYIYAIETKRKPASRISQKARLAIESALLRAEQERAHGVPDPLDRQTFTQTMAGRFSIADRRDWTDELPALFGYATSLVIRLGPSVALGALEDRFEQIFGRIPDRSESIRDELDQLARSSRGTHPGAG